MSRKRVLLGLAILAVLVGTVAGVLAFLVSHEPDFYRRIGLPPGQERQQRSDEFTEACTALATALMSDREWSTKFTDARINSYLDEDFVHSGWHSRTLP